MYPELWAGLVSPQAQLYQSKAIKPIKFKFSPIFYTFTPTGKNQKHGIKLPYLGKTCTFLAKWSVNNRYDTLDTKLDFKKDEHVR